MLSLAILRLAAFRALIGTRFFVLLGLQGQAVIVGWQIYVLTKDPFMLGLVGLAEAIPALTCSLWAGHIVDTKRPERVYVWAIGALMINALFLLLFGGGYIGISEALLVALLFVGVFASGLARAFVMPSVATMIPLLIPRSHLSAANAWMSSTFQIGAIGGPAAAGLLYAAFGAGGAWLMPFLCLSIATILAMGIKAMSPCSEEKITEKTLQSIATGIRFIWNNPILLSVMALDMFAVLFGGAVALLPAYAESVLHVGAQGLGALRAAPAIGCVFVALYLSLRPLRQLSGAQLLGVFAGFGVCMIGFGLSQNFWLSFFLLAVSGAFDGVNIVIRNTVVQLLTPQAMMGRVSAIKGMFIISSNEIGAFESGLAARVMGLVPSVVFGGIAALCVVGSVAFLSPSLRRLRITPHDKDSMP